MACRVASEMTEKVAPVSTSISSSLPFSSNVTVMGFDLECPTL